MTLKNKIFKLIDDLKNYIGVDYRSFIVISFIFGLLLGILIG
jgi:hypothetical protein|tara:strand:- start:1558 stop:1683 length:126 start_codon:yes stop_codon:yes gene_type:complete